MTAKVGVLGGGSWGTALAILLANKGYDITMWLRDEKQFREMNEIRINQKYLPNIKLPSNLRLTLDLEEVSFKKDMI